MVGPSLIVMGNGAVRRSAKGEHRGPSGKEQAEANRSNNAFHRIQSPTLRSHRQARKLLTQMRMVKTSHQRAILLIL
jgi:hypothetical protein